MLRTALPYIIFGYLMGSVLYARVFSQLFHHADVTQNSDDGNPGAFNAFAYGGFWCGALTLCGDLLKGLLPVYLYVRYQQPGPEDWALALVLAAPVAGHLYPIFSRFHGGKGITVSFGCLAGLAPEVAPIAILAAVFLFFSVVVRVTPHFYRTLLTYLVSAVAMRLLLKMTCAVAGFCLITILITVRLLTSGEKPEPMRMEVVKWRR